jgi:5-methylcytosine-specific restriction endonuclease McrA
MPEEKDIFGEKTEEGIPSCPLCGRPVGTESLSDHHLVPRSRGGRASQIPICLDCHKQIHAMYSNKRLEEELNTVEALLADPKFARFAAWVAKRPFGAVAKARRSKDSRKRGRSG